MRAFAAQLYGNANFCGSLELLGTLTGKCGGNAVEIWQTLFRGSVLKLASVPVSDLDAPKPRRLSYHVPSAGLRTPTPPTAPLIHVLINTKIVIRVPDA